MEEPLQKETEEPESQNPNEDEGGIRRRLRDRDLLRKRKAEAEEKETNQEESPRKRPRAAGKSSSRKRGRPRKSECVPESPVSQEEPTPVQEDAAVEVLPEPAEVVPAQTSGSPFGSDTLGLQPAPVLPLPAPVLPSIQSPVLTATLTSLAPPTLAPAPISASVPDPFPDNAVDTIPTPGQDSYTAPAPAPDTVPVQTLSQAPVPAEDPDPSSVPSNDEESYTEPQSREILDQVLIEDLGSDEQAAIYSSQDKGADEDFSGEPLIDMPEQNKMFSLPTLSSLAPQHEYFPGN